MKTHFAAAIVFALWPLTLIATPVLGDLAPNCDFDGDQLCNGTDINQLMNEAAMAGVETDLTEDGTVNNADRDLWLALAGERSEFSVLFLVGDSNLDGNVDTSDLDALALSWRQTDAFNWTDGNFTVNGSPGVNTTDLNELALNWRKPTAARAAAVPEPSAFGLLLLAVMCGLKTRRGALRYMQTYDANSLRWHRPSAQN